MRCLHRPLKLPIFSVTFEDGIMESVDQVPQFSSRSVCLAMRSAENPRESVSQGDRVGVL